MNIRPLKGVSEVGTNSDETTGGSEQEERDDSSCDLGSDEGAKRYNEILGEGSAYISVVGYPSRDFEMDLDDEPSEYRDPELIDPDEDTLPPGEMEMIFENSFLM
jgi:hypothetical protein